MSVATCTTHHDACECRQAAMEAEIARLQAESDLARAKLAEWEDNAGRLRVNAHGPEVLRGLLGARGDESIVDAARRHQGVLTSLRALDQSVRDACGADEGQGTLDALKRRIGQLEEEAVRRGDERDEARAAYREAIEDTARKVALAVAEAVPRAWEQGAAEMQERCGGVARDDLYRQTDAIGPAGASNAQIDCGAVAARIMNAIRALDPTSTRPALDVLLAEPGAPARVPASFPPTRTGLTVREALGTAWSMGWGAGGVGSREADVDTVLGRVAPPKVCEVCDGNGADVCGGACDACDGTGAVQP